MQYIQLYPLRRSGKEDTPLEILHALQREMRELKDRKRPAEAEKGEHYSSEKKSLYHSSSSTRGKSGEQTSGQADGQR